MWNIELFVICENDADLLRDCGVPMVWTDRAEAEAYIKENSSELSEPKIVVMVPRQ